MRRLTVAPHTLSNSMGKCAVVGCFYNEVDFTRMWYDYYSDHFDQKDIWMLDDGSDGNLFEGFNCNVEVINSRTPPGTMRGQVNDGHIKEHTMRIISMLLDSGYKYVLRADADEFIVADPEIYKGGLREFIDRFDGQFAQCSGYDVVDDDSGVLDVTSRPWLRQRSLWHRNWQHYCKVAITSCDPSWGMGWHSTKWTSDWHREMGPHERDDLRLIHMHYSCKELTRRRWIARRHTDGRYDPNRVDVAIDEQRNAYDMPNVPIPDKWRNTF